MNVHQPLEPLCTLIHSFCILIKQTSFKLRFSFTLKYQIIKIWKTRKFVSESSMLSGRRQNTPQKYLYKLQYHRCSEGTEMYKIWSPPSINQPFNVYAVTMSQTADTLIFPKQYRSLWSLVSSKIICGSFSMTAVNKERCCNTVNY